MLKYLFTLLVLCMNIFHVNSIVKKLVNSLIPDSVMDIISPPPGGVYCDQDIFQQCTQEMELKGYSYMCKHEGPDDCRHCFNCNDICKTKLCVPRYCTSGDNTEEIYTWATQYIYKYKFRLGYYKLCCEVDSEVYFNQAMVKACVGCNTPGMKEFCNKVYPKFKKLYFQSKKLIGPILDNIPFPPLPAIPKIKIPFLPKRSDIKKLMKLPKFIIDPKKLVIDPKILNLPINAPKKLVNKILKELKTPKLPNIKLPDLNPNKVLNKVNKVLPKPKIPDPNKVLNKVNKVLPKPKIPNPNKVLNKVIPKPPRIFGRKWFAKKNENDNVLLYDSSNYMITDKLCYKIITGLMCFIFVLIGILSCLCFKDKYGKIVTYKA